MNNLSKSDIISNIRQNTPYTKKNITEIVDAFLEEIATQLENGQSISFSGFGKFEVRQRKERTGVNPRTKEKIKIESSPLPCFKAGEGLKSRVKENQH